MAPIDRHFTYPNQAAPLVDESRRVTAQWRQFFLELWNRTGGGSGSSGGSGTVNSGSVIQWAGASIPNGYLLCDGAEYKRADFATLFAAIGTIYGNGDGSSTFNVPNFVDHFLRGAATPGATGGNDEVTLGIDQMPQHTHVVTDPGHTHTDTVNDPGHTHTAPVIDTKLTAGAAAGSVLAGNTGSSTTGISVDIDAATTGITIGDSGGATPISLVPKFVGIVMVIKT